jgi:curved DNA-binding protein CbpA
MSDRPFVDHYAVLQLSQSADSETVERVYRLLAKRYHPDNADSGDAEKFREVHAAYEVLMDPERRSDYDEWFKRNSREHSRTFDQRSAATAEASDRRIFDGMLRLLFNARRSDPRGGGLGSVDLERMLGVPAEALEFPAWYLKRKGWIEVLDSGQYAITVEGIDSLMTADRPLRDDRLIARGIGGADESAAGAAAAA